MRVALVHDYIKEYGGAERVLEALHEIFPDAPVYTTVYLPEFLGPHKNRFKNWDIRTSMAQLLPFKAKLISPLRIIAPLLFKSFDFAGYDVVIVSATGAYSSNSAFRLQTTDYSGSRSTVVGKHVPLRICYCHTPPRYLYGFATAREWKNNLIFRVLGELVNHFLRLADFKSAQNVDFFIANSKNVKDRIRKFYRKDATVIYPPVDMRNNESGIRNQKVKKSHNSSFIIPNSYFLAGGRIARPKNIELIIKTFEKNKLQLKVFGRSFGGLKLKESRIRNQESPASPSEAGRARIEFLGEVSDEGKLNLMKNAKAFIFASEDEDFGITPVEAMSVGTPVIAYRSGGVVESVMDGKTGIFFDELSIESLSKAIKQFNNLTISPEDCIIQSQKFSKERFKKEMKKFVEKHV